MYYGRPYRFEVDLFAFGVLVFRLLSGKHPFPYPNDLHMLQRRTIGLEYSVNDEDWIGRSDASKDFIHKLIAQQDDRISLDEAKQHWWFQEAGESVLPQDKSYGNQSHALGTSVSIDIEHNSSCCQIIYIFASYS
jgi:serine/threonine protein kinase